MSLIQYKDLLQKQKGLCAICLGNETSKDWQTNKFRALAVDHEHTTGKIRGLLCSSCNKALGGFRDNEQILHNAIVYLRKNK